jgi:hypothetical protein
MGSPLWKRGARGDFIGSFESIGVEDFLKGFTRRVNRADGAGDFSL